MASSLIIVRTCREQSGTSNWYREEKRTRERLKYKNAKKNWATLTFILNISPKAKLRF